MTLELAQAIVLGMATYFAIGVIFALIFVVLGIGRIDPAAKAMPVRARIVIFSGLVGLWPLMLGKWFTQKAPPLS